jgi:filamentous hemagglutinin
VDGSHYLIIDAKTKLAVWSEESQRKVFTTMKRVKSALRQNPGFKAVYEFPNQKVADEAIDFIRDEEFSESIKVRVRQK